MTTQNLLTKDAIEKRRSIRKFKRDPVPDEYIMALIEAARLAPSASNTQPWRFKIVSDDKTKAKLAEAAYHQSFVAQAPVVLVCCADLRGYFEGISARSQEFGKEGALEETMLRILRGRAEQLHTMNAQELVKAISFNVAIAVEPIVLRALDFGLGSCWVRMLDEKKIKDIFGWDNNIHVVALLPLGYPDEAPTPRKRRAIEEIILK
ncbi:MAG: nitroreductase family protein [Euryarchaeota archaeon]|nr:nitroreductase family protein [Euryarchaeota archaeon]